MEKQNDNILAEGIDKITNVLSLAVNKLDRLAASLDVTGKESKETNAGKTREELDTEDELVSQISGPIVSALDAATAEIYGATEEVLAMTEEFINSVLADGQKEKGR